MIRVDDYLGQHSAGHVDELTDDILANAQIICDRANQLLDAFGVDRAIRSGWRPAAVNSVVGGATHSRHMTGQAIDVDDRDGSLDEWCKTHVSTLEDIGLWLEIDTATPTWTHLQCVPPRSGNRFFQP